MSGSDPWHLGSPYERYVGRWSRRVAPPFLDWLAVPAGARWLDVGCGTGALCAAILDRCAPAGVTGVEPSAGFRATAEQQLGARATVLAGDATALPLPEDCVDVVVSGLVLNFVADPPAGLAEMRRVCAAGGTIAAYVWDYAEGMALMRHFWDAATALDAAAGMQDEGVRFPLCRPGPLASLFAGAGLAGVATTMIEVPTPFASFDDYWEPFLGGQGPAPGYVTSLPAPARERLRDALRSRLPIAHDGTIALNARAWAVRGTVPA